MKIKMVRTQGRLPSGLVAEARKLPGGLMPMLTPYQIIEGEFTGVEVAITNCVELHDDPAFSLAEYTEVHQELLQRRKEVEELMYTNGVIRVGKKRAESAADRLEGEVTQLAKELREAREGKKVVIPKEVAEAIKVAWKVNSGDPDVCYHLYLMNWSQITLDCGEQLCNTLSDFAEIHPIEYVSALVNGYTIEQTSEERFSAGVTDLMREWHNEGNALELSRQIDALHRSIYSETASG